MVGGCYRRECNPLDICLPSARVKPRADAGASQHFLCELEPPSEAPCEMPVLQVPASWIAEGCLAIPESNPTRRMLCGMMRAVDSSVKNMTGAYKRLGLWEQTVVFFSTDNVRKSLTLSHCCSIICDAAARALLLAVVLLLLPCHRCCCVKPVCTTARVRVRFRAETRTQAETTARYAAKKVGTL